MAFIGVPELEVYFGPIDDADTQIKAIKLIEQAEAWIRRDCGRSVAELVAAGTADPVLAEQAVCEMVMAVLRNPDVIVSTSETVGGLSESRTINLAAASGLMRLTDDQRKALGILRPARPGGAGGAMTVSLLGS